MCHVAILRKAIESVIDALKVYSGGNEHSRGELFVLEESIDSVTTLKSHCAKSF